MKNENRTSEVIAKLALILFDFIKMFSFVKLLLVAVVAFFQVPQCLGQRQWIPQTTTAGEMWNGYTWYWPYAVAAAEGYRDFYLNAQRITNQLYQQAYITGAFAPDQ